ncbi:NAD(P)/FAD-dependent oxidoreductase [Variovorax sp. KK3]|uniref:NAD(P)/FAD-dependent oxidoreductase n=1 Tax=Variovorax sp. KK3 TaxID=1855728 RepID=UPI00097C7FC9|nr:FAD-dependent oxidoreductase [Variovorax sp. KK3]
MQAENSSSIVVVGGGHAAGRAIEALRGAGFAGRIALVGDEKQPPYERPALSKQLLNGEVEFDSLLVRPRDWYAEQGVELVLGTRAEAIDRPARRVLLRDGRAIAYDRLLLTTGARARPLTVAGANLPGVHAVRTVADALALRERLRPGARLLVVGAGLIGLEVAAVARARGCEVAVLEAGPHALGRVTPPEVGRMFEQLHASFGTEVHAGTLLTRIDKLRDAQRLVATSADGRRWEADAIVAAIGAVPNDELAANAGLRVDNGIRTDEFGRTSDPAIFAAGDVTAHFNPLLGRHLRLETWQNAQNQAIAVARVMAGGAQSHSEVPWFWTDQFGLNFQSAGAPMGWDEVHWRHAPDGKPAVVFYLQDGVLVGGATFNQGRQMRHLKQLIGVRARVDGRRLQDPGTALDQLARMVG